MYWLIWNLLTTYSSILGFIAACLVLFLAVLNARGINSLIDAQKFITNRAVTQRRINALSKAKSFLKPYDNYMGTLTLSNKFCTITFSIDDENAATIYCVNKKSNKDGKIAFFNAKHFNADAEEGTNNASNDFWSGVCNSFSYSTTYYDMYNICFNLFYVMKRDTYKPVVQEQEKPSSYPDKIIDINNSTEAEITALPGINIVMAKKIIKFRNEVRAFNNFDDFIKTMNIKSHFANKLKQCIVIKPMAVVQIKIKGERILDI